jgi:hypothetical protein
LYLIGIFPDGDAVQEEGLFFQQILQALQSHLNLVIDVVFLNDFVFRADVGVCQRSYHFLFEFNVGAEDNAEVLGVVDRLNGLL